MQKELESGNLYVVLVSLKCLKNWGFVPTKYNFFVWFFFLNTHVCKAPLYETSTYTYTSITNNNTNTYTSISNSHADWSEEEVGCQKRGSEDPVMNLKSTFLGKLSK